MKKNKINMLFTFIIIYSLFLGSICLEAASLITKTTFNKMNESLTTFYNNFDENDKYLTKGPFTCSSDRIRCTGSFLNIGTLSKREYEIIGSNSYLSPKSTNDKYWTNNINGSNAYVVNINSIEENPQTDSYGIRGAVYVKNETTFSGTGTRIDPYILNYTQQAKQDINLVAFYIDSDGDGSFEDEPNEGRVDKIDQEASYSLVSSICTDSTGQKFTDMITYNDNNKSVTISPIQYQLSCTIRLSKVKGAIAVEIGRYSSFAIDSEGYLWLWGYDYKNDVMSKPTKIANNSWKTISSKYDHTLAIDEYGYLWVWGDNSSGQLGLGSTTDYTSPQKLGTKKWKAIATGIDHSLAIDEEGFMWAWGNNSSGQLGTGYDQELYKYPTPITVGTKYTCVSSGYQYSFAIDSEGYLWSWGYDYAGQLGLNGLPYTKYRSPQKVGNKKWKEVFNNNNQTFAIDIEGYLWACGNNSFGQLGLGSTPKYTSLQKVSTEKWKTIAPGTSHTLAIDEYGYLWAWGNNSSGQLGLGSTTDYTSPQKVGTKKWKAIAAGSHHSLAVDSEGNLYSWGANDNYQLGNETTANQNTPYNLTLNGYFGD